MPDPLILFANDNEPLIHQAQLALTPEGFRVISWKVDEGALEVIREHTPDLAIIDLWLEDDPDRGWKLYEELRADSSTRNLPVIITFDDKQDYESYASQLSSDPGVRGIRKPYDWDAMLETVRSLMLPAAAGGSSDAKEPPSK